MIEYIWGPNNPNGQEIVNWWDTASYFNLPLNWVANLYEYDEPIPTLHIEKLKNRLKGNEIVRPSFSFPLSQFFIVLPILCLCILIINIVEAI